MNTNRNASSNPANRAPREFNLERSHAVGQFLRVHPDANRTLKRLAVDAEDWNSLGAQLRSKGYGAGAA
jgi:hypothetical protein